MDPKTGKMVGSTLTEVVKTQLSSRLCNTIFRNLADAKEK